MKNKHVRLTMIFLSAFVLLEETALWADSGKMTITYKDQSSQSVKLKRPSSDIMKIEFFDQDETGPVTYFDRGDKIELSCGNKAFVTKRVLFNAGNPAPTSKAMTKTGPVGKPNYKSGKYSTYLSLGCGGSVVLEFGNVWLVDMSGVDLHVFEVGPAVEPMRLEISKDSYSWINLGKISGGKASVDIKNYVSPGDRFGFVRLTDLKSDCGDANTPGADVDTVAAISCILK